MFNPATKSVFVYISTIFGISPLMRLHPLKDRKNPGSCFNRFQRFSTMTWSQPQILKFFLLLMKQRLGKGKPSNFEQMLVPLVRKHVSFFAVTKFLVHKRNGSLFFLLKFIRSRIKTWRGDRCFWFTWCLPWSGFLRERCASWLTFDVSWDWDFHVVQCRCVRTKSNLSKQTTAITGWKLFEQKRIDAHPSTYYGFWWVLYSARLQPYHHNLPMHCSLNPWFLAISYRNLARKGKHTTDLRHTNWLLVDLCKDCSAYFTTSWYHEVAHEMETLFSTKQDIVRLVIFVVLFSYTKNLPGAFPSKRHPKWFSSQILVTALFNIFNFRRSVLS